MSDVYQVVVQGKLHGSVWQNVWYFFNAAGLPNQANIDNFTDSVYDTLATNVSSDVAFDQVAVKDAFAPGPSALIIPAGWPRLGGRLATPALPSFCAWLFIGKGSGGSFPNTVRKFLTAPAEADTTNSVADAGAITRLNAIRDELQNYTDSYSTDEMVIQAVNKPLELFDTIHTWKYSTVIAKMGSRKLGRGI